MSIGVLAVIAAEHIPNPLSVRSALSAGSSANVTTRTMSLTCKAGDVIIVAASNDNGTTPTTTISGGGLTWTSRLGLVNTGNATNPSRIDVYRAVAASDVTAQTITITWSTSTGNVQCSMIVIVGANAAAPFDTNGGLPVSNFNTSGTTTPTATISTTAAQTIILAICTDTFNSTPIVPSGFTLATFDPQTLAICVAYKIVSAAQSSLVVPWTGVTSTAWIVYMDAIVRGP